jgi:hypothetical protein
VAFVPGSQSSQSGIFPQPSSELPILKLHSVQHLEFHHDRDELERSCFVRLSCGCPRRKKTAYRLEGAGSRGPSAISAGASAPKPLTVGRAASQYRTTTFFVRLCTVGRTHKTRSVARDVRPLRWQANYLKGTM